MHLQGWHSKFTDSSNVVLDVKCVEKLLAPHSRACVSAKNMPYSIKNYMSPCCVLHLGQLLVHGRNSGSATGVRGGWLGNVNTMCNSGDYWWSKQSVWKAVSNLSVAFIKLCWQPAGIATNINKRICLYTSLWQSLPLSPLTNCSRDPANSPRTGPG